MASSKLHNVQIQGVLTLTAVAHQTSPGGKGELMKMPVLRQGNGPSVDIPFITANSVRGLIRRAAGKIALTKTAKQGQISRNNYLNVMRGSAGRTGIDAGGAGYAQRAAASSHMFAGLFGGGPYMYPSKFFMKSDLRPITPMTAPLMPQRYQGYALDTDKVIGRIWLTGRDDFAKLPVVDVVANVAEEYATHVALNARESLAKKDQKASAQASGTTLRTDEKLKTDNLAIFDPTGIEVILPGTPLLMSIELKGVTKAQAGLFLRALEIWLNDNALGGGSVRGRGSFKAKIDLCVDGKWVQDNLYQGEAPSYELITDTEQVREFIAAFEAELDESSLPATIASLYPADLPVGEMPAKKGKKEKEERVAATEPVSA